MARLRKGTPWSRRIVDYNGDLFENFDRNTDDAGLYLNSMPSDMILERGCGPDTGIFIAGRGLVINSTTEGAYASIAQQILTASDAGMTPCILDVYGVDRSRIPGIHELDDDPNTNRKYITVFMPSTSVTGHLAVSTAGYNGRQLRKLQYFEGVRDLLSPIISMHR